MIKLIIPLIFFVTSVAFGRIGENRTQCNAQYGEPMSLGGSNGLSYVTRDYTIDVYFDRSNRVECINYHSFADLSQAEIATLLHKNSHETWVTLRNVVPNVDQYENPKAGLHAFRIEKELMIYTNEYDERQRQREDAEKVQDYYIDKMLHGPSGEFKQQTQTNEENRVDEPIKP